MFVSACWRVVAGISHGRLAHRYKHTRTHIQTHTNTSVSNVVCTYMYIYALSLSHTHTHAHTGIPHGRLAQAAARRRVGLML